MKPWKTYCIHRDGGKWYDETCNVLRLKHYLYSPEKSLMEESSGTLRTESRVLMTSIHVCKRNVIYYIYITRYNSLYPCIMIR